MIAAKPHDDPDALNSANRLRELGANNVILKAGEISYVDLRGAAITDECLAILRHCTSIVWLALSKTGIADRAAVTLGGLERLEWLYLDQTSISDRGLAHLGEKRNLRDLRADHFLL